MIENNLKIIVQNYANSYFDLEKAQQSGNYPALPARGDQKTGVFGEMYAYLYLEQEGYQNLEYGSTSEFGWDIKGNNTQGVSKRIQVKTVSAFSKEKRVTPIHHACDILILVYLDENFKPEEVWELDDINKVSESFWREIEISQRDPNTGRIIKVNGKHVKIKSRALKYFKMDSKSKAELNKAIYKISKNVTAEFLKLIK